MSEGRREGKREREREGGSANAWVGGWEEE